MTIKIERKEKPKRLSKKPKKKKLLDRYLAMKSIVTGYTGALMCWTVVFTPIGTACGIVLSKIVDKSKAENSGPNGEGIKYAAAMASNFQKADEEDAGNSPPI